MPYIKEEIIKNLVITYKRCTDLFFFKWTTNRIIEWKESRHRARMSLGMIETIIGITDSIEIK